MSTDGAALITRWWNEAWTEGLWAAAWSKSIDGLTAEQAAWTPPSAPGVASTRHSIWQQVEHMIFWRESWLRRVQTGQRHSDEEYKARNFPAITDPSESAWAATRRRFADTQEHMAAALATEAVTTHPLIYFLPHDCYHFGQINLIRAMLGLKHIE